MTTTNKIKKRHLLLAFGLAGILSFFACNRDFPDAGNRLTTNYPPNYAGNLTANKRVLYIILDGAQGSEIKQLAPANITKLTKSAIYTWIGISGYDAGDTLLPGAWASMMTGVSSLKSKIYTGFDSADLQAYPSFVTRLAAENTTVSTNGYCSSGDFSKYLLSGAVQNVLTQGNDSLVARNIENALKTDSAHVMIGQFHSIASAGDAYGYHYNVSQYASAVNKIDGYIGDIMNALKSRTNYANENWLVIIASNENGKINQNAGGDSTSAYDDTRRNSFIIFNNSRFQTDFVGSNGTPSTLGLSAYNDSALLLTGSGSTGVNVTFPNTNGVYDIHQGDSVTIEFKFKLLNKSVTGTDYFMNLVANGAGYYSNPNGWSFWLYGSDLYFYFGDASTSFAELESNASIGDGQWHTICATYAWPANTHTINVSLYIDGVFDQSSSGNTDPSTTVIHPSNPITIGNTPNQGSASNYSDYYVTDFRYWHAWLPNYTVAQYNCKNDVSSTMPYYPELVTDARLNDGNNSKIVRDLSQVHNDGTINDPSSISTWRHFDEISNAVCPNPDINFYKATPNGIDIPMQIYQWLGMVPQSSWSLDGQYWSSGYTDVQLPANE